MKAIAPEHIDAWLDKLAADGSNVFVPQNQHGGGVFLAERTSDSLRDTEYRQLAEGLRRFLVPQTEDIVRFEDGHASVILDQTDRIMYGLRPCDVAAVAILDEFFINRSPCDPNYLARRKRMRLIATACDGADETCFCASTRTGPVATAGFDVQLYEFDDCILVSAGSDAGEKMIEAGGDLFTPAPADADARVQEFRQRGQSAQKTYDLDRVREIIDNYQEPEGFWQRVADRCLMCSGCAFSCPTCSCYQIADHVESEGNGLRKRIWDTCILGGFHREGSGHNPRGTQCNRCAHRYQHKLGGVILPKGQFRCVGCGRCAKACVTHRSIIDVIEELLEDDAGGK